MRGREAEVLSIFAARTGPPVSRVYGDAAAVVARVVAGTGLVDDEEEDGARDVDATGAGGADEQPARAAAAHPARPASPAATARRGGCGRFGVGGVADMAAEGRAAGWGDAVRRRATRRAGGRALGMGPAPYCSTRTLRVFTPAPSGESRARCRSPPGEGGAQPDQPSGSSVQVTGGMTRPDVVFTMLHLPRRLPHRLCQLFNKERAHAPYDLGYLTSFVLV
ncbi:hypothetical protein GCM10009814_30970 [Lapillicoccus jejuensis]